MRPNVRRVLGEPQEGEQGRDQRRRRSGHQPVRQRRVDQDAPQQRLTLRFQRLGSEQPVPLCRTCRTHPRVPAQVVVPGYLPPPWATKPLPKAIRLREIGERAIVGWREITAQCGARAQAGAHAQHVWRFRAVTAASVLSCPVFSTYCRLLHNAALGLVGGAVALYFHQTLTADRAVAAVAGALVLFFTGAALLSGEQQ